MRYGELAVVLVRRDGVVIASGLVEFSGYQPTVADFTRAIDTVLSADDKRRRISGTTLHVSVGPNHSQLRRLEAIPALRDPTALTVLLQANAASFFLKNGVPLLISGATNPGSDGSAWAAAFDAPLIDAVVAAAREAGLHQVTAVPVSVALVASDKGRTESRWTDGPVTVEAVFNDGIVERVKRSAALDHQRDGASRENDGCAKGLSDAYGAIQQRRHRIRWTTPSQWKKRLRKARPWLATGALLVASTMLAILPTLADLRQAKRNEQHLSSLRTSVNAANQAEASLTQQVAVLARLTEFATRRVGALEVLASLTDALPDSTALVAFHVDSLAGSASIMGRDVMTALEGIQSSEHFAGVEITTPIIREAVGALELERVAIKFKRAKKARSDAPVR